MLQMIRPTDKRIADLQELFSGQQTDCVDDLLRILVYRDPTSGKQDCFVKGEPARQYYRCDLDDKIHFEIAKWVGGLQSALDHDYHLLQEISPALGTVSEYEDKDQVRALLMRTLRMLQLCDALFQKDEHLSDNPYHKQVVDLPAPVTAILDRVRGAAQDIGSNWYVSLPLALLVALGESQCEYFQPFTWEAYSAGRARDELRRLWPAHKSVASTINAIAVLIRCQSAVGQAVRGTGSFAFVARLACGSDSTSRDRLAFTADERLAALRVMAIIEEGRNQLPPASNAMSSGDLDDPVDAFSWNAQRFQELAHDYATRKYNASAEWMPTYGYMRGQYVLGSKDNTLCALCAPLDGKIEALKKYIKGTVTEQLRSVSFGRRQVAPDIRTLLKDVLMGFPEGDADSQHQYFRNNFRLECIEIPDNYSADGPGTEKTLCILLKDARVAERLVLPGVGRRGLNETGDDKSGIGGDGSVPPDGPPALGADAQGDANEASDDDSAAWLFRHLLKWAAGQFGPTLTKDYGHWPNRRFINGDLKEVSGYATYIPFPLVMRIADVVFRLRRERCDSLPISVDGGPPIWIRIPADVKKSDDDLQMVLANFVLGTILNLAMAAGLDHADLDLKGLVSHNCGIAEDQARRPRVEGAMQPSDWRDAIIMLYDKVYGSLLGPYVRNYNTKREAVRFLDGRDVGASSTRSAVHPIAVGAPLYQYLDGYLRAHDQVPMLLIGVDIGGTLTKMQIFQYSGRTSGYVKPLTEVFRMQTEDPDAGAGDGKSRTVAEALREGTKRFAERLVRQLAKEWKIRASELEDLSKGPVPVVIGCTWPGPIRDGHIAAESRPLRLLQWPKLREEVAYTIDDVFAVDVPEAVREAWRKEFSGDARLSAAPFVSILNDGDGEAVGAIVEGTDRRDAGGCAADTDMRDQKLGVVKVGTGLAGGFFLKTERGFELQAGLFEWGKLLLDVGAPPRKGFPQGVAAEYLSKRCLPRLVKRCGKALGCFQDDEPDSGEIGRIAGLWNAVKNGTSMEVCKLYYDLIEECGARQAERCKPWQIPVSVELVRLLLNGQLSKEQDLMHAVRVALAFYGPGQDLITRGRLQVHGLGEARLGRLLGSWTSDPNDKLPEPMACQAVGGTEAATMDNEVAQKMDDLLCTLDRHPHLRVAAETATACIRALGCYLGDFCVLLHDQLGASQIILAGGVLSGKTGEIAIEAARRRAWMYGLVLGNRLATGAFPLTKLTDSNGEIGDPELVKGGGGKVADRGTLGAAAFAAAGFIRDQKATGLQRLTACLLPLRSATQVKVVECGGTQIHVAGKPLTEKDDGAPKVVNFEAFALDKRDLLQFLKESAVKWGYYQSDDDIFIRWVVR